MGKVETATQWMIKLANDNSHGYDQDYRWGERGDYDCSSAVITAWQTAGVPVKTNGATYTGNMKSVFISCGFSDVTSSVNRSNGSGLIRGDVLLNEVHHTAMYVGSGQLVQASINENGKTKGGKPGDQTGNEINISPYYDYWDCVLRYPESNPAPAKMKYLVAVGNDVDKRAAKYLADRLQCPVLDATIPFDYSGVERPIGVGGTPTTNGTVAWSGYIHTVIQGSNRYDTAQKVLNFINGGCK